jgi:chemotaxis protein MotB
MRVAAAHLLLLATVAAPAALCGCAQNAYTLHAQVQSLQQQQTALATRNQELGARAQSLDVDNEELKTLLAQERQQASVRTDEVAALRDQLAGLTSQLAEERQLRQGVESKAQIASSRTAASARITANNSLRPELPIIDITGVEVRGDGDLVRIELPADDLFQNGTPFMKPGAEAIVDRVAAEVSRSYPRQIIGVEGHTDNQPVRGLQGADNHQLSASRAVAVYNHLVHRGRVPPAQLFVAGHGGNHPVVSNATPAGQRRNRRVELVIYPERHAR